MTKKEALAQFCDQELPTIPRDDQPHLDQAWNDFTDSLCKAGEITDRQYRNWTHPAITERMWFASRDR